MFIRDIVIKGGVHNSEGHYTQMTETQLETLNAELLHTLEKFTPHRCPGFITIEYTKELGGKTHS